MFENNVLKMMQLPSDSKKVALSCDLGGGQWVDMNYVELKEIIDEVTKVFMMIGVKKNDRILIISENHYKWLPVFLGITGFGAVAMPIDGGIVDSRLLAIIENSQPRAIIVSKKYQERLVALFPKINGKTILVNFHFDLVCVKEEIHSIQTPPPPPEADDLAVIIYTSGTTGKPKGVMLTHRAVCAAVHIGIHVGDLQASDTMLVLLPLTHVFGLVDSGLCPLAVGARVVMSSSFSPPDIMAAVGRYKVNYINAVPRLAEILLAMLPPSPAIKAMGIKMFIGGAACRPEVIRGLQERGIKAVQGFGMTETAGGVIASTLSSPVDSVGKAPPEVHVRIDAPAGQVGEILIKSPTNTSGVYGKPEMMQELFHDGFLRTGDLGEMDGDGNLKIRGRLKDLIIPPGGMNVYPDELELRLGRLPFAEECAVIGFQDGGHEYPALVVRPNLKEFPGQKPEAVLEAIKQKINELTLTWPEWERFRRIFAVEAPLPRSPSMKIQRNILVQAVGACSNGALHSSTVPGQSVAASPGAPGTPAAHPKDQELEKALFEKLRHVCARFLSVPPESITPQKRLIDFLQLDSLGLVAMLAHFQEVFHVNLRDVDLDNLKDFSGVCHLIMRKGNWEELCDLKTSGLTNDSMPPLLDFSEDGIKRRRKFVKDRAKIDPSVFGGTENAEDLNGNIEGFIGYSMVPIGVAGPMTVQGEYAQGDFYLPLATTEGALVSSIARGMQIITMSGGARTRVLADSQVRAPVFLFSSLDELASFNNWIEANTDLIREVAEKTTRHGKLLNIESFAMGTTMCLRFVFTTADASGQNMTTIATHAAMEFIKKSFPGKMVDCFLEANMSGDKKVNGLNFTRNRGKRVLAEVVVPRYLVEKHLHTTPERIAKLSQLAMVSSLHAHSFGSQAHYANVLAAVFIATGNDAACVAESAVGVTTFSVEEGDLQVTVTLPGLMVGTVGGGTRLPTQKACLEIMDCAGPRKAKKFAEILAAGVLAGEISLTAAMAADEFANAHARYGRRHPG